MSSVVQLLPDNALCVDQESLASRLEQFAQDLRGGHLGDMLGVVYV